MKFWLAEKPHLFPLYYYFNVHVINIVEHLPGEPRTTLLFPLVDSARNLDCSCRHLYLLSLYTFLLFIYTRNYSAVIPERGICFNAIFGVSTTHTMYHLLEFIGDGVSIPWKAMCNLYLCCCHNACFFVL